MWICSAVSCFLRWIWISSFVIYSTHPIPSESNVLSSSSQAVRTSYVDHNLRFDPFSKCIPSHSNRGQFELIHTAGTLCSSLTGASVLCLCTVCSVLLFDVCHVSLSPQNGVSFASNLGQVSPLGLHHTTRHALRHALRPSPS